MQPCYRLVVLIHGQPCDVGDPLASAQQSAFTAQGNKLTLTGPARFQYELDEDGKIKVNDDGSITVSWCLRDEQGKWQHWMTNRFTKRKE